MNIPTYTINRSGQFFANLDACDQCGGAGQKTFRFDVSVTVDSLDSHGFSIDNRHIPEAFDRWQEGRWYASCEDLAAGGLVHLLAATAGRATQIHVRVTANGDSSVEINWERNQLTPQRIPYKAVEQRSLREEASLLA